MAGYAASRIGRGADTLPTAVFSPSRGTGIEIEQDEKQPHIASTGKSRHYVPRDLLLQQRDQMIATAKKAEDGSKTQAAADLAKGGGRKATQTIATTRQIAEAERVKRHTMPAAQPMA